MSVSLCRSMISWWLPPSACATFFVRFPTLTAHLRYHQSRESEDHQTIFELHLVQLSTCLAHPLASKPVLTLATIPSPAQPIAGQCSVCIEVVGDLLCFMFHYPSGSTTPPAMFEVYDWKLGQCLQVRATTS